MSDVPYSYVYFDVLNFTNAYSTTGYALSVCPFTFSPRVQNDATLSNKRILWDFGDGTTSTAVTAVHAYNLPGDYQVTMHLYDAQGNAYYNAYDAIVTVYNYLNDAIVLSASNLNFIASDVNDNAFDVYRFNSWQNKPKSASTILLHVSGNNAPYIDEQLYNKDKYAHLKKYSQFYQLTYNNNLQLFEYVPTNNITTTSTNLYARLSSGALVPCAASDAGSIFIGTSGFAQCAYRDDEPTTSHPTLVFASFDNVAFKDPNNVYLDSSFDKQTLQTNAQSFYCTISALAPNKIFITSTGVSAMPVNAVQFTNAPIPFVVQIATATDAACKYCSNLKRVDAMGALSANTIQIYAFDATTQQVLTSAIVDDFGEFANYDAGIYKGYCAFSLPLTGVKIAAVASVSSIFGTTTLSATTDALEIVDNNFAVFKINENFDQAAKYKSYRFQETLLDKDVFFDSFLGTIVGDAAAAPDALGKRIHEKQANFVNNTQFIDACNVDALHALNDMLDSNIYQFDKYNFAAPAELSRIIDLISIKQSKLWGAINEYAENFDKKGFVSNDLHGINLGDSLDSQTTILTAGSAAKHIVAYEKFSGNYLLINTDLLSSANVQFIDDVKQTYALSAYNDFWGWGLVLPDAFDARIFNHYYDFYAYVATPAGDVVNSIINWSDDLNTIIRTQSSYAAWTAKNGTMEKLLQQSLLQGLTIFSSITGQSAAYIAPPVPFAGTLLLLDDSATTLTLDDASTSLVLDDA